MTSRSRLDAEERIFISQLLDAEPALELAVAWAKRLNKLLQRRAVDNLDEMLAAAGTLFCKFAASLRRDFDAINAALVLPWTTSPVEGQISRIKMLKRMMYGRARFELLRARVLNTAREAKARKVRENQFYFGAFEFHSGINIHDRTD
jgi:transposase